MSNRLTPPSRPPDPADSTSLPPGRSTRYDRDSSAWLVSLVLHIGVLVAVSWATVTLPQRTREVTILVPSADEVPLAQLPPPEVVPSFEVAAAVGADLVDGVSAGMSVGPILDDVPSIDTPHLEPQPEGQFVYLEPVDRPQAWQMDQRLRIEGMTWVQSTGTQGAVDVITQEIIDSLEERKTLVVWFFDQSGSLVAQRDEIAARFERIYDELGLLSQRGHDAFRRHDDRPLLTAIVAFGQQVHLLTRQPTDDATQLKQLVAGIPLDDTGVENVFTAVYRAAGKYGTYRRSDASGQPRRNVLFVVVTDESGNDQQYLDQTVNLCRRYEIPVFVIGVPAPFGRVETFVKWVDPDPRYDQTPHWLSVQQGPESLFLEHLQFTAPGLSHGETVIDSGFGPFALTRLCTATGGIYFAIHPNRRLDRAVGRGEVSDYAAHLSRFFDPAVMKAYAPDYVSAEEYRRQVESLRCRQALVRAADASRRLAPLVAAHLNRPLRRRFVKTDDAGFVNELTEAQKVAATLEPYLAQLYEILMEGEADRKLEPAPRWQAGYDLAAGRLLALRVRYEGYNAMLAQAKRGMAFTDKNNNTWHLMPEDQTTGGTSLTNLAQKAREYLTRVVAEHANTPWAYLASRELERPLGWKWREEFIDMSPPKPTSPDPNANANAPAQPSRPASAAPPKPRRDPPRL